MKKHYLNIFCTILLSISIITLHFTLKLSLLYLIPVFLIHIIVVIYGVLNLDFNYFFPTITHAKTAKKEIAITFDDGPTTQCLVLLELLKETATPATFFCIGSNVVKHPEILKRMDEDGHLIGNHSFSHSHSFDFFPKTKVLQELKDCNAEIQKTIGKRALLFRPPNGVSNPMIAKALKETKLKSIGWNIRTFDTAVKNPETIFNKINTKIKPGAIILMHDTMPHTSTLVSKLIKYCRENNYKIVALDKLLNIQAYE